MGSARLRRSAAYLSSWEQCFGEVARAHGHTSAQALLAQAPRVAAAMEAAGADLRGLGVGRYQAHWAGFFDKGLARRQRVYGSLVQAAARKKLLARLERDDQIDFRSAGGRGWAFLLPTSYLMTTLLLPPGSALGAQPRAPGAAAC